MKIKFSFLFQLREREVLRQLPPLPLQVSLKQLPLQLPHHQLSAVMAVQAQHQGSNFENLFKIDKHL